MARPAINNVTGWPEEQGPRSEYDPYPQYRAGEYEAECVRADIYHDRQFRTWKACLRFRLMPDGLPIYCFMNLGNKAKPHAGPRSEYRRAWIIANGAAPKKRQTLSPRVFERKLFAVRVDDVTKRFDGREHPPGAVYSTVREILKRTYP